MLRRILLLLALPVTASLAQPLPFATAPLETVTTECRNGTYGGLTLSEISGATTLTASFASVSDCDSATTVETLPAGACAVQTATAASAAPVRSARPSTSTPVVRSLDIGPQLTLTTPAARELTLARTIFGPTTGYSFQEFRTPTPAELLNPVRPNQVVVPGKYSISAEGGRDLPAFREEFEVKAAAMTRPAGTLLAPATLPSATPPTIEWSGGEAANAPATVSVSFSTATRHSITCQLRDGRDGKFTIPEAAWNAVPAQTRAGSFAVFSFFGGMQMTLPLSGTDGVDVTVPFLSLVGYALLTP